MTDGSIASLAASLEGRVITHDDEDYDRARTLMPGGFDLRPAAIARVAHAQDVARVITFARERGVELAVRCGGHSPAGHGGTDGGIVLDLRELTVLEIDVEAGTEWAQTGLTAGGYTAAAAEHGLATGFGDTASVGIGGITLAGGIGYLVRKHGLTIDSLLEAEIVTADGEILRVGEGEHPDLFWAIRGGGGNFGVATRFHYRLHPLDGVYGGMLFQAATVDVIEGFIAAAEAAPDELSGIANVMVAPPMPFVPEAFHGELIVMSLMCFAGDAAAGERALAPFRALGEPLADMLRPMPYPEMYPPEDDSYHPTAVARTMFMDRVDTAAAAVMLEHLEASDASVRVVQLRALGGAMAQVPADATAFAHRKSRIMANVAAFYEGPDDKQVRERWVVDLAAALHQDDAGAYVGFLGDEGPERFGAAYPGPTGDRLAEVKLRYDPDNLFRRNQNVTPA